MLGGGFLLFINKKLNGFIEWLVENNILVQPKESVIRLTDSAGVDLIRILIVFLFIALVLLGVSVLIFKKHEKRKNKKLKEIGLK